MANLVAQGHMHVASTPISDRLYEQANKNLSARRKSQREFGIVGLSNQVSNLLGPTNWCMWPWATKFCMITSFEEERSVWEERGRRPGVFLNHSDSYTSWGIFGGVAAKRL